MMSKCHNRGHALKTQKQHTAAATYFLGVSSGPGTILDALYLILILKSLSKEFCLTEKLWIN